VTISLPTRHDRSSERAIQVEKLGVRYGDFDAVKDLSFHVERGELYALLGTNGAGKTSALEVIEGHRNASSGTVRVFGHRPTDRRRIRPRVGIMLQESGFAGDLTVAQTVRLLGRLSSRTDSVERVVSMVDLTRNADTKVSQLSGGEKRRLDFATAVYGRPELIILDEPTTGLDIQTRDPRVHHRADHSLPGGGPAVCRPHRTDASRHAAPSGNRCRADTKPAGFDPVLTATRRSDPAAAVGTQSWPDERHPHPSTARGSHATPHLGGHQ
jgi:ABC-2 type transport system ATP-binding protein